MDFIALLCTDCAIMIALQAWMLYLIPYAEQKGMTPYEATTLASVGNIAYPLSAFVPALTEHSGVISDNHVRFIGLLISGISFTVYPWFNSLASLICIAIPCLAAIGACHITGMSVARNCNIGNFSQVVAYEMAAVSLGQYLGGLIPGIG